MAFAESMALVSLYQASRAQSENDDLNDRTAREAKRQNKLIHKNAMSQYQDLSAIEADIIDRGHEASLGEKIALMQSEANLEVQASAAGAGGRSLNLMMLDLKATHGRNMNTILDDTYTGIYNVDKQAEAIQRAAESGQIKTVASKRDPLDRVLNVAYAGLQGYAFGSQLDTASGEAAPARNRTSRGETISSPRGRGNYNF